MCSGVERESDALEWVLRPGAAGRWAERGKRSLCRGEVGVGDRGALVLGVDLLCI